MALPISSTLVYYHTQDNISGIRARAIEITLIFKIHLGWKKDTVASAWGVDFELASCKIFFEFTLTFNGIKSAIILNIKVEIIEY